jgi:hypothetical protein
MIFRIKSPTKTWDKYHFVLVNPFMGESESFDKHLKEWKLRSKSELQGFSSGVGFFRINKSALCYIPHRTSKPKKLHKSTLSMVSFCRLCWTSLAVPPKASISMSRGPRFKVHVRLVRVFLLLLGRSLQGDAQNFLV